MHHNHSVEPTSSRDHKVSSATTTSSQCCAEVCYRTRFAKRSLLEQILQVSAFAGLLLIALQTLLGSSRAFANDALKTERHSTGTMVLGSGPNRHEAILLDASVDLSVQGLLADMRLEQTFRNTTGQWLEGRYLFPLPADAAVRGLTITVGDRVIKGQVMPRMEAKQQYNAAKDAGQVASLVEQNRPNLFTMRVASIAPNDDIKIELEIMLPVKVRDKAMELVLPTTLTPRYTNALTPDADALDTPFARQSEIRGPRISLTASISPLDDLSLVSSPTHSLDTSSGDITLTDIPMDRDIVLHWPMRELDLATGDAFTREHNGKRYLQVLLSPPSDSTQMPVVSRELILVMDKSGSMAGESIRAAREAIHSALDGLTSNDSFNIIAFDDRTVPLFPSARPANGKNINRARRFADRLNADGGTEMHEALQLALRASPHGNVGADQDIGRTSGQISGENSEESSATSRLRQLVFLTDGSVGYEESLLDVIKQQLGNSRLFTIGIGSAPNTWFLEKAAEAGRGVSLSIRDTSEVAASVTKLLSRLEQPVITDINLQYANGFGEIYPKPLTDLYAGQPTMIVGQISADVNEIVLTGRRGGERWSQTIVIPESDVIKSGDVDSDEASSLAMHWARAKVESLLDEQRGSIDNERHKDTITALAIDVGLLTPYTSFVAIEAEPIRPTIVPTNTVKVANLVPHGNDMQILNMPQGAAGSDTLALLSTLFALFGSSLLFMSWRLKPTRKLTA